MGRGNVLGIFLRFSVSAGPLIKFHSNGEKWTWKTKVPHRPLQPTWRGHGSAAQCLDLCFGGISRSSFGHSGTLNQRAIGGALSSGRMDTEAGSTSPGDNAKQSTHHLVTTTQNRGQPCFLNTHLQLFDWCPSGCCGLGVVTCSIKITVDRQTNRKRQTDKVNDRPRPTEKKNEWQWQEGEQIWENTTQATKPCQLFAAHTNMSPAHV